MNFRQGNGEERKGRSGETGMMGKGEDEKKEKMSKGEDE